MSMKHPVYTQELAEAAIENLIAARDRERDLRVEWEAEASALRLRLTCLCDAGPGTNPACQVHP